LPEGAADDLAAWRLERRQRRRRPRGENPVVRQQPLELRILREGRRRFGEQRRQALPATASRRSAANGIGCAGALTDGSTCRGRTRPERRSDRKRSIAALNARLTRAIASGARAPRIAASTSRSSASAS
jgi:hypothetical protein